MRHRGREEYRQLPIIIYPHCKYMERRERGGERERLESVASGAGRISDFESVLDDFASLPAGNLEPHAVAFVNLVVRIVLHFHALHHLRLQPRHQPLQPHHHHYSPTFSINY